MSPDPCRKLPRFVALAKDVTTAARRGTSRALRNRGAAFRHIRLTHGRANLTLVQFPTLLVCLPTRMEPRLRPASLLEGVFRMLTIFGRKQRFCDGVSRRSFLKIGAFAFGAYHLSLADVLRAETAAGQSLSPHKAVINIFLGGGPPHQDMWDLKMEAPAEIRGEFKPINTRVPGIQICEVFPRIAGLMDRCAIIRSVVGSTGGHDAYQCMTGWSIRDMKAQGGRPSLGSIVSKLQGTVDPSVPAFVGLAQRTQHVPWSDPGATGFLGPAYLPFKPEGPGLADLKLTGV